MKDKLAGRMEKKPMIPSQCDGSMHGFWRCIIGWFGIMTTDNFIDGNSTDHGGNLSAGTARSGSLPEA